MLSKILFLVDETEAAIIFVNSLTELVEVFSIYFDSGGRSVPTTADNIIFREIEGVGKIKIAKTTTRAFEDVVFGFGEDEDWFVVSLN